MDMHVIQRLTLREPGIGWVSGEYRMRPSSGWARSITGRISLAAQSDPPPPILSSIWVKMEALQSKVEMWVGLPSFCPSQLQLRPSLGFLEWARAGVGVFPPLVLQPSEAGMGHSIQWLGGYIPTLWHSGEGMGPPPVPCPRTVDLLDALKVVLRQLEVVCLHVLVEGRHDGAGVIGVLQPQRMAQLVHSHQKEIISCGEGDGGVQGTLK